MIKVSLKSPQLSSSLPAPVDLAANIKNAARCPAPAALGGGGCLSAHQPVLFWDYLSKAYQSNLSITGRQPSQSLRQYILALAPASPALLSRFNFIFIRSTEKDIFSRSISKPFWSAILLTSTWLTLENSILFTSETLGCSCGWLPIFFSSLCKYHTYQ